MTLLNRFFSSEIYLFVDDVKLFSNNAEALQSDLSRLLNGPKMAIESFDRKMLSFAFWFK